MWDVIRSLVSAGTTLLLTTQYLEEADELADRIAVVDTGKIIAEGTADELKAEIGGERVEIIISDADRMDEAHRLLSVVSTGDVQIDKRTRKVISPTAGGSRRVLEAAKILDDQNIEIEDIALRRPSLDDVFLNLTGRKAEEVTVEDGDPA
jgi:ABC-2 type transport system ATP-binding protein